VPVPKFGFPSRNAGNASLTRTSIIRRKIEKKILEVAVGRRIFKGVRRVLARKQTLNSFETALSGRREPGKGRHLAKHPSINLLQIQA